MAVPSLFEDCQAWVERGHESWKSYFSKWETFAKYEENIPESELVHDLDDLHKSKKNQSKKRPKHLISQKRWKAESLKNMQIKQKKLLKRGKNSQRIKTETRNKELSGSCGYENIAEIVENPQLEVTLNEAFIDLLKANRSKFEMFTVLFQTFSQQEVTFKNPHNLFLGQKQKILSGKGFETNVVNHLYENQQALPSPLPKFYLNDRSICPARDVYIQRFHENHKEISFMHKESEQNQYGATNVCNVRCDFKKNSTMLFLTPLKGSQTPQLVVRQNVQIKSCPPLNPTTSELRNLDSKSIQLDWSHVSPSRLFPNRNYFKNTVIAKMNIILDRKRLGNLCSLKRTNSVGFSVGNSNLMTPERKSEQNRLGKIVSQRRQPSKKLFFDNEEEDSESDDQTEYHSPRIQCPNKRPKTVEPEMDAVESDSDDCQSIFDRTVKI